MYVILVPIAGNNHTSYDEIGANLKTSFSSYEYMMGFLDGYFFISYRLMPIEEYEKGINNSMMNPNNFFTYFINVEGDRE